MESDGKAVSLVPHPAQQPQSRRVLGNIERLGMAGAVYLLQPLGQSDHRHVRQPQVVQGGLGHAELPFTPVDEDQVGQGRAFIQHPPVAPGDHFVHGGIVIGPGHGLDVVLAVIAFARPAV